MLKDHSYETSQKTFQISIPPPANAPNVALFRASLLMLLVDPTINAEAPPNPLRLNTDFSFPNKLNPMATGILNPLISYAISAELPPELTYFVDFPV